MFTVTLSQMCELVHVLWRILHVHVYMSDGVHCYRRTYIYTYIHTYIRTYVSTCTDVPYSTEWMFTLRLNTSICSWKLGRELPLLI